MDPLVISVGGCKAHYGHVYCCNLGPEGLKKDSSSSNDGLAITVHLKSRYHSTSAAVAAAMKGMLSPSQGAVGPWKGNHQAVTVLVREAAAAAAAAMKLNLIPLMGRSRNQG